MPESMTVPSLNVPQAKFLALPNKFKAFVAGYGSGKTWVGCADLCKHHLEWPRVPSGYFAPTYPQIRDIFFPTIEEVAHDWGMTTRIKETDKEVHLFTGRKSRGVIICRSMEKPSTIVGFKIGKGLVDEIDTLTKVKAAVAWRKIIARMRVNKEGLPNGISVTTTPEGFKFVYDQFVKQLRDKPDLSDLYGIVQASTYDNELNLPDDYIPSLMASYPPQLIDAYLNGQFVNLTSGSVYPDFCRVGNHTDLTVQTGDALHIGMDFNVMNMTAIVFVIRDGMPHAVAEITGVRDTPTMAKMLKERYLDKGHAVSVYPDASGQNTSSKNASESDLSILRQNNFTVRVNSTNPAVRDRVNAMNGMILSATGERRLKVNTDQCPQFTEALEQQAYDKNGEPDKTTGHDHPNDAGGYVIAYRFPIVKPNTGVGRTTGL